MHTAAVCLTCSLDFFSACSRISSSLAFWALQLMRASTPPASHGPILCYYGMTGIEFVNYCLQFKRTHIRKDAINSQFRLERLCPHQPGIQIYLAFWLSMRCAHPLHLQVRLSFIFSRGPVDCGMTGLELQNPVRISRKIEKEQNFLASSQSSLTNSSLR